MTNSIPCPFPRCSAAFTPVPIVDHTGAETGSSSVPAHDFEGAALTGLCPASFQPLPLDERLIAHFDETVRGIDARAERDGPSERVTAPVTEPRTVTPSTWFRPSPGGQQPHGPEPVNERPVLRLVDLDENLPVAGRKPPGLNPTRLPLRYLPPSGPTTEGGSVPSVAETRAALAGASQKIAEAMDSALIASGLFAEAHTMLATVRAMTDNDLGMPVVEIARDQCEQAFVRGHAAIETITTYGGTL